MHRNDVNKLVEEVSRVDYMCTSQEHELKALSDRMCDLGQLKETVKVNSCVPFYLSFDLDFEG